MTLPRVLYIEPFHAGSHATFTRTLVEGLPAFEWTVLTLPGRHWKWRMRGSAAWFARKHADVLAREYDVVFASSYLPLAELVGLVPRLGKLSRLLYFHENQLAFPVREEHSGERDHHYGFTQLVSALAATRCAFNSAYNRDSFLAAGRELLHRMPDAVAPGWIDDIEARSAVVPLPLRFDDAAVDVGSGDPPLILWNHRWEHDKGPDAFFEALDSLAARGVRFRVAVCGRQFRKVPPSFEVARPRLGARVIQWGSVDDPDAYRAWLRRADIVVSTAEHEFFGVSMLEGTHAGAYPLVPDRLAYPELFPVEHRYAPGTLVDRLTELCARAATQPLRADRRHITAPCAASAVLPRYEALLHEMVARGATE